MGFGIADHQIAEITMTYFTDEEFAGWIAETKQLPVNWRTRLKLQPKDGTSFEHRSMEVGGDSGSSFRVMLRRNTLNNNDFSLILVLVTDDGEYRLTRFNGSSHQHVNHIERRNNLPNHTIRNTFHIHVATERYQRRDRKNIEGYAVPSAAFGSFETAFEEFFATNGFVKPPEERMQKLLFAE